MTPIERSNLASRIAEIKHEIETRQIQTGATPLTDRLVEWATLLEELIYLQSRLDRADSPGGGKGAD